MIDVKDLRIGNVVDGGDYVNNPSTIIKIDEERAIAKSQSAIEFTSINGIELSRINLSSYRFTEPFIIDDFYFQERNVDGGSIRLKKIENNQYEVYLKNNDISFKLRNINWLHELQNIFYFTFGIEL